MSHEDDTHLVGALMCGFGACAQVALQSGKDEAWFVKLARFAYLRERDGFDAALAEFGHDINRTPQ